MTFMNKHDENPGDEGIRVMQWLGWCELLSMTELNQEEKFQDKVFDLVLAADLLYDPNLQEHFLL